jgi:hypothetical protein
MGKDGRFGGCRAALFFLFVLFFFGVVECGFYRGFLRKASAERGVFVVSLWWKAW